MISTVGELISELKKIDPESRVISLEPPFTGVKVVDQGNGSVLICAPDGDHALGKNTMAGSHG